MATRARTKPATGPRAAGKPKADPKAAKTQKEAQEARERAMNTKLLVDDKAYRLGDLTLGEIGELEDHTGMPMDLIRYNSARTISYVVYLVRRRDDPKYTLEDAESISIDKVGGMTVDGDGDPVVGAVGGTGPDPT